MRCLSVCLSRSCILSKRIDIIIFIFSPSGSHTILVFLHQTSWQYSDENSPNEASNAGGVAGNRHSEPISGSIACCQRCDRHRCYQHGAAGPWQVVTLIAGSATEFVDGGNDNEIFMTRSLNFSPKTTEQHLIACSDKSVAYVTNYFTTFLFSLGTPLGQSRLMLYGGKENSMLTNCLAACAHLTITISEIQRDICEKVVIRAGLSILATLCKQ